MPRLPRVSGRKARTAFERAGYVLTRINGSHFIMRHAETGQHISVPDHDVVKPGFLSGLIRRAGLTTEEFVAYLG